MLSDSPERILKVRDAADQFQADGVAPAGGTPEHFRETIAREILVWKKVAQDANVKVE